MGRLLHLDGHRLVCRIWMTKRPFDSHCEPGCGYNPHPGCIAYVSGVQHCRLLLRKATYELGIK